MTRFAWIAPAFAAGLMLSQGASAQTSAETEIDPAQAPIGVPVEDGLGSTYVADTHGDWEIRCIRVEEGEPEPCQMYQLLTDDSGNPVAEVNVFDLPDADQVVAGATIVTPLDTLLAPQLRLRVDDGQPLRYPFSFCQPVGCFVRIGLTENDLEAFRAGAEGTVTMVPLQAPDQTVDLTISLSGFTAGFEDVAERLVAAQAILDAAQEN